MSKYVAQPFVASSPEAEVKGWSILGFVENVDARWVAPLRAKYHLDTLDPEAWYPHQMLLSFFKDMSETRGSMSALVMACRTIVKHSPMPPEIDTLPEAMQFLQTMYRMNHRNVPEEEGLFIEELDENHYMLYDNTPFPSELGYGYIWSIVSRFAPSEDSFLVQQVENPNPDEHPGRAYEVILHHR